MIRLMVHGAEGRMGKRVCSLARADVRFELVAAIGRDDAIDERDVQRDPCDVIVDFSSPSGTERAARLAVGRNAALLVGTTGLSRQILGVLDDAARLIPCMIAPNTSRGVAANTPSWSHVLSAKAIE